jgi:hypothetical protein
MHLLHHESQASEAPSQEDLKNHYKDSQFLMMGEIFGVGNGCLGKEVCDEVIRRNDARKEKEAAFIWREKNKLCDLVSRSKVIKDSMKDKKFNLTIDQLCILVTYKKMKEDLAIPTRKVALLAR